MPIARLQAPGDAWLHADLDEIVEFLKEMANDGTFKADPRIPFTAIASEELFHDLLRM